MAPRGVGGASRISGAGSGAVLRMSPSRSIEICTCWKSCQICDSLRIGCTACEAIMLKATSAPTLSWPSITALAPNNSTAAVVSLLTYWMAS